MPEYLKNIVKQNNEMNTTNEILNTFEKAQLTVECNLLKAEIIANVESNKRKKNNFFFLAALCVVLIVGNIVVYSSIHNNQSLNYNAYYSRTEAFKELSNELLINTSQHK